MRSIVILAGVLAAAGCAGTGKDTAAVPAAPPPAEKTPARAEAARVALSIAPGDVPAVLETGLLKVVDAITAVKDKYPELREWDRDAVLADVERTGGGIHYAVDYEYPTKKKVGRAKAGGCYIAVRFQKGARMCQRMAEILLPRIDVEIHKSVQVGPGGSAQLVGEIDRIVGGAIEPLRTLDSRLNANAMRAPDLLTPGMSEQEVLETIGAPDIRKKDAWGYVLLPTALSATVLFREGKVVEARKGVPEAAVIEAGE
ncbi:MAG: hypothetical protein JW909_09350 [Planctomycetes bacterium]|nr:hypothetical protein [Planctomycetota bacterium]